jgi:hypothetical protein
MVKAEMFGPNNYDSCANRIKKLTGILLIFHPGCGHCVQMRPEWEAMKRRLPPGTKIMELDGSSMSDHQGLLQNPIIRRTQGFPSILKLKNGTLESEFQGPRVASEMHKFSSMPLKGMKKSTGKRKYMGKQKSVGKRKKRKLTRKK